MIKHRVMSHDASRIWEGLQNRGGIAIWHSADLSDPGKTWTTPLLNKHGYPAAKQHWKMEDEPRRQITDPEEVVVDVPKEVKRFHIALRRGSTGFSIKLTDGSSRKLERAVEKANEQYCQGETLAWYEFDYDTQEAVILVPDQSIPIEEFIKMA